MSNSTEIRRKMLYDKPKCSSPVFYISTSSTYDSGAVIVHDSMMFVSGTIYLFASTGISGTSSANLDWTIKIYNSGSSIAQNTYRDTTLINSTSPTRIASSYSLSIPSGGYMSISAYNKKDGYVNSDAVSLRIYLTQQQITLVLPSNASYINSYFIPMTAYVNDEIADPEEVVIQYNINQTNPGSSAPSQPSAPTSSSSGTRYTTPLRLSKNAAITAKAFSLNGIYGTSNSVSRQYSITIKTPESPIITPASGSYNGSVTVHIDNPGGFGKIYYTLDGSTPDTTSFEFLDDFNLNSSRTVKAIIISDGLSSSVVSASYTVVTGTVSTEQPTNITTWSAVFNGIYYGNEAPDQCGFYWKKSSDSTNSQISDLNYEMISPGVYSFSFSPNVSMLPGTQYTYQAWAKTKNGSILTGSWVTFTTATPVSGFGVYSISSTEQEMLFGSVNISYYRKDLDDSHPKNWGASGNIKFIEKPWSYIGNKEYIVQSSVGPINFSNKNGNYNSARDLFGFGTSANSNSPHAICYQPWSVSTTGTDYCPYNNSGSGVMYDLRIEQPEDYKVWADWASVTVYKGCPGNPTLTNQSDQGSHVQVDVRAYPGAAKPNNQSCILPYEYWTFGYVKTPSYSEMNYLLNTRSVNSGKRFAKGRIQHSNNTYTNGLIIFSDQWNNSYYTISNANTVSSTFNSNTITELEWENIFNRWAIFLPAAGYRVGTEVQQCNEAGYYWTRTCKNDTSYSARCLVFTDSSLSFALVPASYGCSVRLCGPANVPGN